MVNLQCIMCDNPCQKITFVVNYDTDYYCKNCYYIYKLTTIQNIYKNLYDYEKIALKIQDVKCFNKKNKSKPDNDDNIEIYDSDDNQNLKLRYGEKEDMIIMRSKSNHTENYVKRDEEKISMNVPILYRHKGYRVDYDWLFNQLYLERNNQVYNKAYNIFIKSKKIPFHVLELMSRESIQLLANERYPQARKEELEKYQSILLNCGFYLKPINNIIFNYIYPEYFKFKIIDDLDMQYD